MQVDPYSNEIRYPLSLMAFHLNLARPSSVRIASRSPEMVKSVLRYLCDQRISIFVETKEIQTTLAESLGLTVNVPESERDIADVVLLPFSLEDGFSPRGEKRIIALCHNGLSYKTLLRPFAVKETIFHAFRRLKPNYDLDAVAGFYSPRFIAWLSFTKLMEHLNSALYFQLEDRTMQHFIERGPLWRLSYIVLVTGRATR